MTPQDLPHPNCPLGYNPAELHDILGDNIGDFTRWMAGQTVALCTGTVFNHDDGHYEATACDPPHGVVIYPWDVTRYLKGQPPLD